MPQSMTMLRSAITALCLAGLAACGGDDASDAPGDPIGAPADVRWHLQLVMSQVPVASVQPAFVPSWLFDPLAPLDGGACPGGGTTNSSLVVRNTPYTLLPLLARQAQYNDCVMNYGPTENPTEATLAAHGVEESARVQLSGGAEVNHLQSGAGSTPIERRLRSIAAAGNREEDHRLTGRSDTYRLLNAETRQYQATLVRTHELQIRFPSVANFAGTYRFGSPAAPFRMTSTNDVTQISGEYEISTSRCRSGAMQLTTTQDLVYDAARSRFVAGTLEFSGASGTARASFREDGRVTLTAADGSEKVETFTPLPVPWAGACFGGN